MIENKNKILFVDDENILCSIAENMFLLNGFDVLTLSNSKEALNIFYNSPEEYDLIVTDQNMPLLTGIELSLKVRRLRDEIPIILCSGLLNDLSDSDMIRVGIDAFFEKPYSFDELIVKVNQLVTDEPV